MNVDVVGCPCEESRQQFEKCSIQNRRLSLWRLNAIPFNCGLEKSVKTFGKKKQKKNSTDESTLSPILHHLCSLQFVPAVSEK